MTRDDWNQLNDQLETQMLLIQGWPREDPNPVAIRCEQSRHRTLAHLRSCQEQWLSVVSGFAERESPNVTIIHPWRQFARAGYAEIAWDTHLEQLVQGRWRWFAQRDSVDWERGGKWNRKPDTIGGLICRLAEHEAHHLRLVAHRDR